MSFMKTFISNIKDSKYFEFFSILIILSAATIYGIETFQISNSLKNTIYLIDYSITVIFIVEIFIRMFGEKRAIDFFKDPWNVFDFAIVSISLIPVEFLSNILIARVVRVFRVMRLITHVPKFKSIINAFFKSVPRVAYVMALMFVIFYIYAILGSTFFESIDPSDGKTYLFLCGLYFRSQHLRIGLTLCKYSLMPIQIVGSSFYFYHHHSLCTNEHDCRYYCRHNLRGKYEETRMEIEILKNLKKSKKKLG